MRQQITPHGAAGFTLVEILVVIVIVGIMAGLAVLNLGGNPHRELQSEARRLQLVVRTALDEAMMQGREFGLLLEPDSYQVLIFNIQSRNWEVPEQKAFAAYRLPEAITLEIELEGELVDLMTIGAQEEKQEKSKQDKGDLPQLIFFSSGETGPFAIQLRHREAERTLRLATDGIRDMQIEQVND